MLMQSGRSALAGLVLASAAVRCARLVDFQVAQPPPLPQDANQCTIQILQYVSVSARSTAPKLRGCCMVHPQADVW